MEEDIFEKVIDDIDEPEVIEGQPSSTNEISEEDRKVASEMQDNFMNFLVSNNDNISVDEDFTVIPTGIDVLDTILGGGFGCGFNQIVGNPGTGKSALAANILAHAQRVWPKKFLGIYLDAEESMTKQRLSQLGVNFPSITPIGNLTVEKVFKIIETLCVHKEKNNLMDIPSLIIWDSLANTQTQAAQDSDDPNKTIGQRARFLSNVLPKYVVKLKQYKICLLTINQLRDKIDMGLYGSPPTLKFLADKNIPGGNSSLFNSFQILFLQVRSDLKDKYGFSGVTVKSRTIKNKLFSPNIEFDMLFGYNIGFSNFWTNFELMKEFKRINASAWSSLVALPDVKFRQKDVFELYLNNPEFRKCWDDEVAEVLKVEFTEKYETKNSNDEIID